MRNSGRVALALGLLASVAGADEARAQRRSMGPAMPVDAPGRAPALGPQRSTAVAFGGGTWLAAWIDDRGENRSAVMVARVKEAAPGQPMQVLDDPPVQLSEGAGLVQPAAGFDGKRFLVVWVTPNPTPGFSQDIDGAYVGSDGKAGTAFHVVQARNAQYNPAVAGGLDGQGRAFAAVTWLDAVVAPMRVHAGVLDENGAPAMGVGGSLANVQVSTNATPGSDDVEPAAIAWNGERFVAAWAEGNEVTRVVRAAAFAPGEALVAPVRVDDDLGMLNLTQYATVAADGAGFVIAWSDLRNDPANVLFADLYGQRLDAAGQPQGANVLLASTGGAPYAFFRPSAVRIDAGLFVAWEMYDYSNGVDPLPLASPWGGRFDAALAAIDGGGGALGSGPIELEDMRRATVASDGKTAQLGYTRLRLLGGGVTGKDTYLLPVDVTAAPVAAGPVLLSGQANLQRARSVAANGGAFLVVWEDSRDYDATGLDVYGLRFDGKGAPLDVDGQGRPRPFVISAAPGDQFAPVASAVSGGDFLVAFADARGISADGLSGAVEIHATRVKATGAPLDGDGFLVSKAPARARLAPTVAASPTGWLVAWEDWRTVDGLTGVISPEVWSAFVTTGGEAQAERSLAVSGGEADATACAASAAWTGSRFLVAWEQPCSLERSPSGPSDVRARWAAADGKPDDAGSFAIAANAGDDERAPAVTAGPAGKALLVWRAGQGGDDAVRGAALDEGGRQAGTAVSLDGSGVGAREAPSIAFDAKLGRGVVSWIDANPKAPATPGVLALGVDAELSAIGDGPANVVSLSEGSVLRVPQNPGLTISPPYGGAEVAGTPRSSSPAAVALGGDGVALIAWNQLAPSVGRDVPRVRARTIGLKARGAACGDAGQCLDGICTGQGVCCDTACDGICRTCTADGCVGTPPTDTRCGGAPAVSCAALSSTCRTYEDPPPDRCVAFGQCAEAASLAACTVHRDATDGTTCGASACGGSSGVCRAGACVCPGSGVAPELSPWALALGCAVVGPARGGGDASFALASIALLSACLLWRGRRRRGAGRGPIDRG